MAHDGFGRRCWNDEDGLGEPGPESKEPDLTVEPLLTARATARELGCLSSKRLVLLARQRRLTYYRFGRLVRFRLSEVVREIRSHGTSVEMERR